MSETPKGAAEDFTADVAALRQDVGRLAETVSQLVKHQVADAEKNVCAARDEITAPIERHPITAVLIAFSIGMLIGKMNPSRG